MELGREVQPGDIPNLQADAIILATGAEPLPVTLPGAANSPIKVVTPHTLVRDGSGNGGTAVLWDQAGGIVGTGAMDALIDQGCKIHLVTPQFSVAEDMDVVRRVPLYERLLSAGAVFVPNSDVVALDGASVVIRNVYSQAESRIGPVELLVAWAGSRAIDRLRSAIEAAGIELHLAGDAIAPRTGDIAFAEGAMAARSV